MPQNKSVVPDFGAWQLVNELPIYVDRANRKFTNDRVRDDGEVNPWWGSMRYYRNSQFPEIRGFEFDILAKGPVIKTWGEDEGAKDSCAILKTDGQWYLLKASLGESYELEFDYHEDTVVSVELVVTNDRDNTIFTSLIKK